MGTKSFIYSVSIKESYWLLLSSQISSDPELLSYETIPADRWDVDSMTPEGEEFNGSGQVVNHIALG